MATRKGKGPKRAVVNKKPAGKKTSHGGKGGRGGAGGTASKSAGSGS